MKSKEEKRVACYADEQIMVKTADGKLVFSGVLRNLHFTFRFSSDNPKEDNSVECNIPGISECCYYPFHILGTMDEECKGYYDRTYEDKSVNVSSDNLTYQSFRFEKSNGEVLFSAKLLKITPLDWFETPGGNRRQRPPYNLLPQEKTQGIGYAENIYLHPIKQLLSAGINRNETISLNYSFQNWYYEFEEYIETGKVVYPNGRLIIMENANSNVYRSGKKIFRPSTIVKDYVEINGVKTLYVASYSSSSNDNKADVTVVFQSDSVEGILLKFEGSFIRQSVARIEKIPNKIRGYVAYYHLKGVVSTVGMGENEISESVDLYSDKTLIEDIAMGISKHETFNLLTKLSHSSEKQNIDTPTKSIGIDDLVGMDKTKQTFEEFRQFSEYKRMITLNHRRESNSEYILLDLYNQKTNSSLIDGEGDSVSLHMAFLGSPGTGKSTVAERIAAMLKEYGLAVTNEIPIIVVKSDLVGKYVGHTEEIVRKKIEEAMGGILFVDEAYSLFDSSSSNDFGRIALNEIMYAMEQHRDKLVVILAGYTEEMLYLLKNANPGLTSRIPWYFYFDDYSAEQMWEILNRKVEKNGYKFDIDKLGVIKSKAIEYFTILKNEMDNVKEEGKIKHFFGNGRGVRTFFQYMQIGIAIRFSNNKNIPTDLYTFQVEEIDFAYNTFKRGSEKLIEQQNNKAKIGFDSS